MQVNLVTSHGNFQDEVSECNTQKNINFDKIGSINISGDNNSKEIVKSLSRPTEDQQKNSMKKSVDYDKLDEVFQKFRTSAMTYNKNGIPNYIHLRQYPKKLNKIPQKKIESTPQVNQSCSEAKPVPQSQSQIQPNYKINFMVNKVVNQSQTQSQACINQFSLENKIQMKQVSKIKRSIKKTYESPTKIVIPLVNINVNEIQEIPPVNQFDNNNNDLDQRGLNYNQLPKLPPSRRDINLNCINSGNSSSKEDNNNPNRSSRKCLKKIKKLLLQLNNKYQTVNDIVIKNYLFAYNNTFYSLIMNKKAKRILSLSKNEINDKETIYKEEIDIFNELHSIKDSIEETFLSHKRHRDS